uniref:Uncharacterized protein n=1 Tax=Arundo donax TaxID=35708 RepID=A0A0A9CKN7_ARUDO
MRLSVLPRPTVEWSLCPSALKRLECCWQEFWFCFTSCLDFET